MDFYQVVEERYSYRGYKADAIPKESLERIANAVSLAPTACNLQPFEILVVLNDELRRVATSFLFVKFQISF